ncbi:ERG4/ERG24 ergosterol biosynthesis protein [Sistotremastrum suecicum HHB10207 ss-3]|uniref:Delta(14)-sterol reductase ERG24 n=1 Tax=Sistotremastrum suecicum HHB10207 ss-3 TaxID=1314776 RepID=A0A166BQQ0_9AGAM|nr:ERG4/ERG24 ergosterol biosynthesis protein [Sistotremastrum suecicum HHB10207 ss-3]
MSELNPRTTHYEFMGPPGAFAVTFGVPFLTFGLSLACSEASGGCPNSWWDIPPNLIKAVSSLDWWFSLFDLQAFVLYLAWYAFCVVSWAILPGAWVEGSLMRNGQKKLYKINAFSTLLLVLGITGGTLWSKGPAIFTVIYDRWIGLVTASVIMSFAQAFYVYAMSFQPGKLLALGGNSGNFIYDFYIGRELNPSVGSFDIKCFNELRPGLILWAIINFAMACEQYTRLGAVTDSMVLINAFQFFYVADALYNEPSVLTTMDITTDGFGFMLAIGDLAWVPFIYSLQARYLAFHPVELGPVFTSLVLALNVTGYYIFRVANAEKDDFRNGRNPKNLTFMITARGTKLLTSGWWGRSRHPNYLGDLLMSVAWSLTTGFSTPITYFYPVYFLVLLIHRQLRDDENCYKKYGADWEKYKALVPWRIIPYVY